MLGVPIQRNSMFWCLNSSKTFGFLVNPSPVLRNDTCSGLQHHVPNLRGKLVGSWRLLKARSKTELPNRATPMSQVVLQAFMGIALKEHGLNHALCYALCFQGFPRPAEAFQLVPQAVDLDLQACSAILMLKFSKGATRK